MGEGVVDADELEQAVTLSDADAVRTPDTLAIPDGDLVGGKEAVLEKYAVNVALEHSDGSIDGDRENRPETVGATDCEDEAVKHKLDVKK